MKRHASLGIASAGLRVCVWMGTCAVLAVLVAVFWPLAAALAVGVVLKVFAG